MFLGSIFSYWRQFAISIANRFWKSRVLFLNLNYIAFVSKWRHLIRRTDIANLCLSVARIFWWKKMLHKLILKEPAQSHPEQREITDMCAVRRMRTKVSMLIGQTVIRTHSRQADCISIPRTVRFSRCLTIWVRSGASLSLSAQRKRNNQYITQAW